MQTTFGTQLRDWRQRRRLSQLELGMTADVSARHISFLETGRARPSRPMVMRLSETLTIPRGDRNNLLLAAGFSAGYTERPLEAEEMQFVREAIQWSLDRHNPYPGIALDRHWRIVSTNACANSLLQPMGLDSGDSLLDAMVADSPFAAALENRDEVMIHLAQRLRTESSYLGGDAILDQAIQELERHNTAQSESASEPKPAIIPAIYKIHGVRLSFFSTISQFGSTEDLALADMKLELMFPADELTREFLWKHSPPAD